MIKRLGFFVLILLISFTSQAQQGWEVGGWVGASHYLGDLNTSYDLTHPKLAGGAIIRYNFNERLCLRFGANYGSVIADDKWSSNNFEKARNLNFKSHILEGLAQFEFNFLPYIHGSRDKFYTPYLFGGFSIFSFKPLAGQDTTGDGEYDNWVELQPLGTEGQFQGEEYFTVQPAFVYGFGFKIDLTVDWSVNVELSSRALFTDYLDDVSTRYPDMDDLESLRGPLAVEFSDRSGELGPTGDAGTFNIGEFGRQRGNSQNNDMFAYLGVGIVYYFGSIKCPQ